MGHVPAHTQLALHRCVASPDNENQFHSMCLKHKSIFQVFFWIWKLNFSNTDYFWISFVHLPANIGFFAIVVMVVTVVYGIASDWQSVWVLYTLSFFSHNSFGVTNGMPNACSHWTKQIEARTKEYTSRESLSDSRSCWVMSARLPWLSWTISKARWLQLFIF